MARLILGERARKSLRDIGSIVLGVRDALAIGEVADNVRHRVNARRAMTAVRAEMGVAGVMLEERMMKGRCIVRRLDALRGALATARQAGRLARLGEIGRPNHRSLTNVAWTTLVGNELLYAPREDVEIATRYFAVVNVYLENQTQEQQLWARLRVLEDRPDSVGDDLMAEL